MALRILVVDDERIIHRVLQRMLQRIDLGESVDGTFVPGVTEAIEAHEASDPAFDLILTNLVMPKRTGLELLEWVREHEVDVPVVLMTGGLWSAAHVGAFTAVLQKPFSPAQLQACLRQVLHVEA